MSSEAALYIYIGFLLVGLASSFSEFAKSKSKKRRYDLWERILVASLMMVLVLKIANKI